jgi:HEAT repeat protein
MVLQSIVGRGFESHRLHLISAPEKSMTRDFEELIALLKDNGAFTKECRRFGDLELPTQKQLVPILINALEDNDQSVRKNAVIALREIGAEARAAIPALSKIARDASESTGLRNVVLASLRCLGALAELVHAITDGDLQVRTEAINQAAYAVPADILITPLINALKDEKVRSPAASALRHIGAQAVPFLEKVLESEDANITVTAARSLLEIDATNRPATAHAVRLLKHSDPEIRGNAAFALMRNAGSHAEPTIEDYKQLLRDENTWARSFAAAALRNIGPPASLDAFDALKEIMHDPDPAVYPDVYGALGEMGPHAKSLVPELIDAAVGGCAEAAEALGNIGPDAKAALPHLQAVLEEMQALEHYEGFQHSDAGILEEAAREAILQIKGLKPIRHTVPAANASIPSLVEALLDGHPLTKIAASDELIRRGAAAVPPLVALMRKTPKETRASVIAVFREMGPKAEAAIPALIDGLADREIYSTESMSHLCALALGRIGVATIPALKEAAKSPNQHVRTAAARLLNSLNV